MYWVSLFFLVLFVFFFYISAPSTDSWLHSLSSDLPPATSTTAVFFYSCVLIACPDSVFSVLFVCLFLCLFFFRYISTASAPHPPNPHPCMCRYVYFFSFVFVFVYRLPELPPELPRPLLLESSATPRLSVTVMHSHLLRHCWLMVGDCLRRTMGYKNTITNTITTTPGGDSCTP